MAELPEPIYAAVTELSRRGDELAEAGDHGAAIRVYEEAWALIPEPKTDWQASTWLLAAIADAAFLAGDGRSALAALDIAMTCPDGLGNPFLHLRRGQVLLDLEREDAAADELMRAYMGGSADIFEDEDGRYLAFLKTRATL